MAYGYMRPDPVEQFRGAVGHYGDLILAAVQMGYTEAEAIELIKVYAPFDIVYKLDGISF